MEKKHIYSNLLNGVSQEELRRSFSLSDKEIADIVKDITNRVRYYLFTQGMPYIKVDTIANARRNHALVSMIVDKLDLEKPSKYKKITHETINKESMKNFV